MEPDKRPSDGLKWLLVAVAGLLCLGVVLLGCLWVHQRALEVDHAIWQPLSLA